MGHLTYPWQERKLSYDLMVFEPTAAPKDRAQFMQWYAKQTEWSEEHSYQDHAVASEALQAWFKEIAELFPPMNGPLAFKYDEDADDSKVTDYSIGRHVIYSGFSWRIAEEAYPKMRELAIKHHVGFFDVSATNGEILFPTQRVTTTESRSIEPIKRAKPWWKFW